MKKTGFFYLPLQKVNTKKEFFVYMNDDWLEIIDLLQCHVKNDSLESAYQHEIEGCFRTLGWKKANHTLKTQVTLNIGNCNSLRPDIVLYKNDIAVLPIEIKRPGIAHTERQSVQLGSYMRQLKLNVGLFIGNNIQLYYDCSSNHGNTEKLVSILTAELQKDDINGPILCELLKYDKFNLHEIEEYCKSKYSQTEAKKRLHQLLAEYLSPSNAANNIKDLIIDKFEAEGFDKNIISEELKYVTINVSQANKLILDRTDRQVQPKGEALYTIVDNQSLYAGKTSFSLDGINYVGIGRFVLEVVKRYVQDHPTITFEELNIAFPPKISSSKTQGLVRPWSYVKEEIIDKGKKIVFFIKPMELIQLHDQTLVAVYNQWGNTGNSQPQFQRFLEHVETMYRIYAR